MVPCLGVQVPLQGCAGAASSRLLRAVRAHLSPALLSDITAAAGNQPGREYLHHGNWQTLQIKVPSIPPRPLPQII